MSVSILEQVRLAIRARLLELVTERVASAVTCPRRYGRETTYQDREIVLRQMDAKAIDEDSGTGLPSAGCKGWERRFWVYCWRRLSETSDDEIDATLNAFVAEVADKLDDVEAPFASPQFYLDVEEDLPVSSPDRSCDGRALVLHVWYEHRLGDAFSQV